MTNLGKGKSKGIQEGAATEVEGKLGECSQGILTKGLGLIWLTPQPFH